MDRVDTFLDEIIKLDCDCAIIYDRANVRYLSGFCGSSGHLIISPRHRILVTDFRYIEQAKIQAEGFDIVDIATFDAKELGKSFSSVAFENESVSYMQYLSINENFKNPKHLGKTLLNMRSVKDSKETENIRKAEKIGDDAFSYIISTIKEGMTELAVAREIDFYMLSNGAERLSFETIVASGERGAMPHAVPTDRPLKKGDLVVMDFGCVYNGYCSDMTRTIGIGNISDELKEAYNTVLNAQLSSLEKIRSGVNCDEIHKIAFNIIDKKYPRMFGHALGHGVGLEIHEQPVFSPKANYKLPENAVITVEPGVYIPGLCGVRIEDLVLVTENGYENLTTSSKELILI